MITMQKGERLRWECETTVNARSSCEAVVAASFSGSTALLEAKATGSATVYLTRTDGTNISLYVTVVS